MFRYYCHMSPEWWSLLCHYDDHLSTQMIIIVTKYVNVHVKWRLWMCLFIVICADCVVKCTWIEGCGCVCSLWSVLTVLLSAREVKIVMCLFIVICADCVVTCTWSEGCGCVCSLWSVLTVWSNAREVKVVMCLFIVICADCVVKCTWSEGCDVSVHCDLYWLCGQVHVKWRLWCVCSLWSVLTVWSSAHEVKVVDAPVHCDMCWLKWYSATVSW